MSNYRSRMLREDDDDDSDSLQQCRERRRRRMERRRLAAATSSSFSASPASQPARSNQSSPEEDSPGAAAVTGAQVDFAAPLVGAMSVAGRSRDMEDAVAVRLGLCSPEISRREPVHFFGVYDGHGGPHVASLCRERLHVLLEEEVSRVRHLRDSDSGSGGDGSSPEEEEEEGWWRRALRRSFERMDEAALSTCACGSVDFMCGCHPMEVALSGSTAVVAVVTPEHIAVANCGDSRAVLCRRGRAVPLSSDHKPDRADELARIEAAGGQVIFVDGARVEGVLAMSRAIGDKFLKPAVTSEPEITFTKREDEDNFLILASDGLWDVLSSELACEVAFNCLGGGGQPRMEDDGPGELYPSRSALAAALLTRLALGRRSADNISVIVVDLKRG